MKPFFLMATAVLLPGAGLAQVVAAPVAAAFDALPLPVEVTQPMTLSYGAPDNMRPLLPDLPSDQAAFAATARAMPQALSAQAARFSRGGAPDMGFDITAISEIAVMQTQGATALTFTLAEGEGADVGAALQANFEYIADDRLGQPAWRRRADGPTDLFTGFNPASHVTVDGDLLTQASSWELLQISGPMPEDVAPLLAALEAVTPAGAQLMQLQLHVNLPVDQGFPLRSMLIADIVLGLENGVVIAGIAASDAEAVRFGTALTALGAEVAPIDQVQATALTALPDPNLPPWRNELTEQVQAALQNGSFWDAD